MISLQGKHITYLGDWVFYNGPQFIESPFEMMSKDCHLQFLGAPVTTALEAAGATTRSYSNWELYHFSPETFDQILDTSDLIIISDVEARCFHLNPDFFTTAYTQQSVITFPDRLKVLTRAVEQGVGLIYLGGWLSFSGYLGKAGWGRCAITNWLPFQCLPGDDLVESSEGFTVDTLDADHPVIAGLPMASLPPMLGYNEFTPRASYQGLWQVRETGHPLLGVSHHGAGRMVTLATDPVPHWGLNFMHWDGYAAFWQQAAHWAIGGDK